MAILSNLTVGAQPMTDSTTVRLHFRGLGGPGSVVEVDGLDISPAVHAAYVDTRVGEPAWVTLELAAPTLEFEGEARVQLSETTRAALVALGWTPLQEVIGYRWTDPATGKEHILSPDDVAIIRTA